MLRKQALINLAFAVPKNRKPKFDLTLRILDLTNIPLLAGTATVRWHLSSSTTADHRGRTPSTPISEHKAIWEYEKTLPVRLTIDKLGNLQECDLHFEILQEFDGGGGGRGSRVHLGNVKLNLAEYTRIPDSGAELQDESEEEGTITRRYLLQDSKINSTLKISIRMRQTEGDVNFQAPPLKSAMVVGGIAGVLTTENGALSHHGSGAPGEGDDIPSITSKTRELSEAQDIYRRTLAATWACQAGELAPDTLIENLFAGGDGGRPQSSSGGAGKHQGHGNPARLGGRDTSMNSSSSSDEPRRTYQPVNTPRPTHQNLLTPQMAFSSTPATSHHGSSHSHTSHKRGTSRDSPNMNLNHSLNMTPLAGSGNSGSAAGAVSGRSSIDQQIQQSQAEQGRRGRGAADYSEFTEFDLRDDLRSWRVGVK
ncbi:hypothetical protein H2200_007194 [Cladophialophora chaetospira]|uniref:C2 NT-type domain-containing protein n=1 Tax=Cladophialophora chaetospira TaxID=386627 RepID=A0AA38X7V6_9EURO|nr:hypothetical protein H2200_007194 [Cladophialophora chaetospira]